MSPLATESQSKIGKYPTWRPTQPPKRLRATWSEPPNRTAMEVFIARQAIFDRRQRVFGYELLFRSRADSSAAGASDSMASLQVMTNSFLSIGVERLLAGTRAFINFPQDLLADERAFSLPPSIAAIE